MNAWKTMSRPMLMWNNTLYGTVSSEKIHECFCPLRQTSLKTQKYEADIKIYTAWAGIYVIYVHMGTANIMYVLILSPFVK